MSSRPVVTSRPLDDAAVTKALIRGPILECVRLQEEMNRQENEAGNEEEGFRGRVRYASGKIG